MPYRNILDKINVDEKRSHRLKKLLEKGSDKFMSAVSAEHRGIDNFVDELVLELRKTQKLDLKSKISHESSKINENYEIELSEKEIALQVYIQASEKLWQKWGNIQRYTNSSSIRKLEEAQKQANIVENYLILVEKVSEIYNIDSFEGYSVEKLNLIFEDFDEIGFVEMDDPASEASKIVEKDQKRLEKLYKRNRKVEKKLDGKRDVIMELIDGLRSHSF